MQSCRGWDLQRLRPRHSENGSKLKLCIGVALASQRTRRLVSSVPRSIKQFGADYS